MKILIKYFLLLLIAQTIHFNTSGQCYDLGLDFAFKGKKWAVFAEGNGGTVLTTDLGNGWELGYGGGLDWAPFTKFFYFSFGVKHIQHRLNDNTPNIEIFPDGPYEVNLNSRFFRSQFGMKIRFDWLFKSIDYEGIHLSVGMFYLSDNFHKENTELKYSYGTVNSNLQYSESWYNGTLYEVGFSWVLSDYVKWDVNGYIYESRENYSLIKNGFGYYPRAKIGIGVSTGVYFRFGS